MAAGDGVESWGDSLFLFGCAARGDRLAPLAAGAVGAGGSRRRGEAVKLLFNGKVLNNEAGSRPLQSWSMRWRGRRGWTLSMQSAVLCRRFRMPSRAGRQGLLFDGLLAKAGKTPTRSPASRRTSSRSYLKHRR